MKSRQELKTIAKAAIAQQRGVGILLILLFSLIYFGGALLSVIPVLGILLVYGTTFFIDLPLMVNIFGGSFVKIQKGETVNVGDPFTELFSVNYMRKVGGMAWMTLWVTLWSLLFVIPGIIKGLSYMMAPYILANHPNVKAKEALKLSMRMTNGYKMELFVACLSFIGWFILSSLTLGVLWIVYVGPYFSATFAGYFLQIRDKAIADGVIQASELE